MQPKYKYQLYQQIYEDIPRIVAEAEKEAAKLGLDKLRDEIGLYSGSSACPGSLPYYVLDAIVEANQRRVFPLRKIEDELRERPEIDRIISTSRAGISVIRVFLKDAVNDTDPAWSRLRDELDNVAAQMPPGVPRRS